METRDDATKELERVCREKGISENDIFIHKMQNNDFIGLGINLNDIVVFTYALQPCIGKLTMLTYIGEMQPVLLLGYDFLKHPIISTKFINCPDANSYHFDIDLKCQAIAKICDDQVFMF